MDMPAPEVELPGRLGCQQVTKLRKRTTKGRQARQICHGPKKGLAESDRIRKEAVIYRRRLGAC